MTVPWGPLIAAYLVLAGLACGATLSSLWARRKAERTAVEFHWRATWISLATLALCIVILIADLGHPDRALLMLTRFTTSPMSVGAKLIAAKAFLLLLYLFLLHRRRQALAAGDETLAGGATRVTFATVHGALIVVALCLAVYPAVLLSMTWHSPLARGLGGALLFLLTALLMGASIEAFLLRDNPDRRPILLLLGAHLLLILIFVPAWVPLGVGFLIPFVLSALPYRAPALGGAALALAGAAAIRVLLFIDR